MFWLLIGVIVILMAATIKTRLLVGCLWFALTTTGSTCLGGFAGVSYFRTYLAPANYQEWGPGEGIGLMGYGGFGAICGLCCGFAFSILCYQWWDSRRTQGD